MIASIEVETIATQICSSCGAAHQIRTAIAADDSPDRPTTMGFFERCPVTGERVWLVVSIPEGTVGRMTQFGPIDDLGWDPVVEFEPFRAGRFEYPRPAAFGPTPGAKKAGRRAGGPMPKLLRLAWGCPF